MMSFLVKKNHEQVVISMLVHFRDVEFMILFFTIPIV